MQAPSVSPSPVPRVEGLRDIVVPAPVNFGPRTVGWYVLFALLAFAAIRAWRAHGRRRAANRYRREALLELERIVAALDAKGGRYEVASRLPELLKRVALEVEPRASVAGLTGPEWLAELDRLYGGDGFSKGPGRLLPRLAYGTTGFVASVPRADIDALVRLSRDWLKKHRRVAA